MARIRTIKPEFWTSDQVVSCSPTARLLFIGLWNFADDAGIHPSSVKRIKMEIFPADDFDSATIRRLVVELLEIGLLEEYQVDGTDYLIITGWKHQKIEKPSYKYPKPESGTRRPIDDHSPTEGNGMEGNGRERRGERESDHNALDLTPTTQPRTQAKPLAKVNGTARFIKPTIPEIREYCESIPGCTVDPAKFWNHYEMVGWRVGGKAPMKDWRAGVRSWNMREKQQ